MPASPTLTLAVILATFALTAEPALDRPEPWARILSLMEEPPTDGGAEPAAFLKSLTPEEMLLGARQACAEVANRASEMHDMPPEVVAEIYVTTCLHYYFDKVDQEAAGAALLKIVRDRSEAYLLRRALISRIWETDVPFDAEFQAYVANSEAQVTEVLTEILKGPDHPLVRRTAMQCVGIRLGRQASEVINSDPNVREALEEKRRQTDHVIFPAKLVRSGEVTLTEDTMKALAPVEARTLAYVKLLGAIVADKRNEPEDLRKDAKRRLEGYRKSALMGIDAEVEKALRAADE